MSSAHWEKAKRLFESALELEPAKRSAFLDEACPEDPSLRGEVESLLGSFEQAGDFIQTPAMGAAAGTIVQVDAQVSEGRRIGAYKLIRSIAQGGMGTVCLAVRADDQYRKRVAIKLIKRGMDTDSILRRFRNERQILAGLDHPNIAKLLDGGTADDGLSYFVMDYIEGRPIDEYCDAQKLSIVERLGLFRKVCSAVQFAHQNLVVHRDIKPGNILVTADGVPKLLDFGIAKLLNPEMSYQTIDPTAAEFRPMTPEYASPEQIRGETITTASDIYSLGVLLYELLTGHKPYRLKSRQPQEIAQIICENEPEKLSTAVNRVETLTSMDGATPRTLTPESVSSTREGHPEKLRRRLAGDLDNIVLMAMRKEPQRRYVSVEQFSEDTRRHLAGLPVIARKDTLGYRSQKFIKRNKAGVIAAALIALSLVAGIAATAWQAREAKAQRAKAVQRFNDVRKLANSFLFEFHDAIEKLPGSTPARALLVKRALEYLDNLAQEARDDPSLQRDLATAYGKVGDIQGNPYSANLGDRAGAMQSYRKALGIRESMRAADPDNVQAGLELAATQDKIGEMLVLVHDMAGAEASYRQALQAREAIASREPALAEARRELAKSYESIGDIRGKSGDDAGALENSRQSLQIREALLAADPMNAQARRGVAVMHGKLGAALAATKDIAGALESVRKSVDIFEALAAADPMNGQARRELAYSYNKLGDLFWETSRWAEALESYRKSLAINEALSAADPTNVQARRDLAVSYGNTGYALVRSGDASQGLENYRKSLAIFEAFAAADPSNASARHDLTVSYAYFGDVYKLLASNAAATSGRRIEYWREARSWYARSLEVLLEMRKRGILRGSDGDKLAEITRRIADCDAAAAKLQGSPAPTTKR